VLERLLDGLGRAVRVRRAAVLIKARDGMDMIVSRAREAGRVARIVPRAAHVAKR